MKNRELTNIIFNDLKPESLLLKGLSGYSMYPTLLYRDKIYLDYDVAKGAKDSGIYILKDKNSKIYIHRYHKGEEKTKGDETVYWDSEGFEVLAKVSKIRESFLHPFYKFKYNLLYYKPKELQLVLALINLGEDFSKHICTDGIDFNGLYLWLKKNDMLLYFSSRLATSSILPKGFVEKIHNYIVRENLKLTNFYKANAFIKDFFNNNGIEYIPMKGMDFATRYYDDPYQREMCDIDIMIQKKDLSKALSIIEESEDFEFLCKEHSLKAQHHVQVKLKKLDNVLLEIHWKHFYLDYVADFEKDLEDGVVQKNENGYLFTDEMNICLSTVSFFTSTSSPFKNLLDVYLIDHKKTINLDNLSKVSSRLKCNRRLFWFFSFFVYIFNRTENLQYRVSNRKIFSKIRNSFFKNYLTSINRPSRVKRAFFRAYLFEGFYSFIGYFFKKIRSYI